MSKEQKTTLKPEQLCAVEHGEGNVIVSASAGSGKTFVMIERAIRLIEQKKANVNQILAVTFTESAATEMKEKLKSALAKKINEGRADLSEQLLDVAYADISTIHAFCSKLIRSYFFVAGVSPDFKIIDEIDAGVLRNKSLDKTFKELYKSGDKEFLRLRELFSKKRNDLELRKIILEIYFKCENEPNPNVYQQKYQELYSERGFEYQINSYNQYLVSALSRIKRQAVAVCEGLINENTPKLYAIAKGIVNDIEEVIAHGVYRTHDFANYNKIRSFTAVERKKSELASQLKEELEDIRKELEDIFKRYSKHLTSYQNDKQMTTELARTTRALMCAVQAFAQNYAREKAEENALDFSDLEHYALKVLDDESICKDVKNKYKYIFVDEYQDVNAIQEQIISKVSNDNIFMVGDVKQSIYGFRGCRSDIFAGKYEKMKAEGQKVIDLNYNFRSSDAVIQTVNQIFTFSMTEDYYGTNYKNTSELKAGGVYPQNATGRSELHVIQPLARAPREKEEPRIYDLSQEYKKSAQDKASPISALINKIIREELNKTYYSTKEKAFKQITFGDIVILTRNKKNAYVSSIVEGLARYGVPVVSEVQQGVCDFAEVQLLINALKLIDCFEQDVPLATVMKSPIGRFTEEELAEISLAFNEYKAPLWSALNGAQKDKLKNSSFRHAYAYYLQNGQREELQNKLKAFDEYIKALRFTADFGGAKVVLERLVTDCDYQTHLYAQSFGESKVRRVYRFISLAEWNGNPLTVAEFLDKIENSSEAFKSAETVEENTVRIMTIHASKGLEFPVVIVCGLERKANSKNESEAVLFDRDLGFAVRHYNEIEKTYGETVLRGLIQERIREERLKEELRLFYVASTRAGYSMHLTFEGEAQCLKHKFNGAVKMLDYLPATIALTQHSQEELMLEALSAERRQVIIGKGEEHFVNQITNNLCFSYPFEKDTALPLKSSASQALHNKLEEHYTPYSAFNFTKESFTGAERGVIAHKILEFYDFSSGESIQEQAQRLVDRGILEQSELELVDLNRIQKALSKEVLDSLRGKSIYREQGFIAQVPANLLFEGASEEGVLVQGYVDLLAVGQDGIEIIDYKYSAKNIDDIITTYAPQLNLYAVAAQKAFGKKVTGKTILNIYSGESIKIP